MDAAAELGKNPVSKHQIQPEYGDKQADDTHGDRGIFVFSVQLTTSRISNLNRLIHTLLYVMTIHTYIHTYIHTVHCGILKKNQNAPRPSEHPPVRGENVKTFRWDHRLQIHCSMTLI